MDQVVEFLDHHGVKGQKWGIRNKSRRAKTKVVRRVQGAKKKSLKTQVSALSDDDLSKALKRMNMEQQYISLKNKTSTKRAGQNFVKDVGKTAVKTALVAVATHHVTNAFKKAKIMK